MRARVRVSIAAMTRSDNSEDAGERRFLARAVRLAADNAVAGQLPFVAFVVRGEEERRRTTVRS